MKANSYGCRRAHTQLVLGAILAILALVTAACGGATEETSDGPNIIEAGSVRVQLPDDFDPNEGTEEPADDVDAAPGESASAEDSADVDSSTDTGQDADDDAGPDDGGGDGDGDGDAEPEEDPDAIPLAEDDTPPIVGLLEAFQVFSVCLGDEGFEFVGAPGQNGASPDDFEPAYMQALQLCAAQSNIVQAIANSQAADAALTAEEIEDRNEGFLVFVPCLELRGWTVAEIVPDERGLLQAGAGNGGLTPPPGVDFFDSNDVGECIQEAAETVDGDSGE